MKITSITIAKNESANIGRCLRSLNGIADEIIVIIDASTTDNTEEIVQSFTNVRYKVMPWQGYAKTKEYAVLQATHPWVLWIDADEEVSGLLHSEIMNIKKVENPANAAFAFPRKALFLGRWIEHCGWYPGYVTRIFNTAKARFTSPEVHEGLIIEGSINRLKSDLLHYTDPNIAHYFEKFNNYTSLAAIDLRKRGKKFSISDIIIRPPFLFFKMYVLKAGFLDGFQGFLLSVFSAYYVLIKYAKLWEKETTAHDNKE